MKKGDKVTLSKKEVLHLAKLAGLTLTEKQLQAITSNLSSVIEYMAKIKSLNTSGVKETTQVTNQENVFREDIIDKNRMLTQEQALSNAKEPHNGYFKVKSIFNLNE